MAKGNRTTEEYINQLEKECAYLQRKLLRMEQQRRRQETIDDLNRAFLRHANDQLQQFYDKTRLENLSKSDFLANMSHEIRTPLNIILGMANLLAETELNDTQSQYLSSLRITGRQLMEILNNILEFSRIEAGKISVESEPFNLMKIIGQLEATVLPLCMQKNLEFIIDHDPFLIMERKGDSLKIFQILLNLINNAVKFTNDGSVTLKIEEDLHQQDHLQFHVIDTGIGITKKQQQIIFDRFTQANESLSQQHSGAGLGLAICRRLTKILGGKLSVSSAAGKGAIFSCHIPLPPLTPSERTLLRFDATLVQPKTFPPLKILVVDDVKENIDVIEAYLEDYPVQITSAANGQEALDRFCSDHFDIVLMDIRMPVMDGITATKTIRNTERGEKTHPQIILAVTAHAFQEQKKRFLAAGFDDVITKPFFRRELIQTLYRFGRSRQAPATIIDHGNKALGHWLEQPESQTLPPELVALVPQLIESITADLTTLRTAFNNNDLSALREKAHSLKGVAAMFGFRQLADLVADLSASVKNNQHLIAAEVLDALDLYLQQLVQRLPTDDAPRP